ncbi:zinc-dependent alcohol dehydrogenase [Natronosalvus caseinilyticus]|uniref:zinc-dependent alcohol dehydrogenase n=1 Tax=Natronosalvus caseinilyticus TaxID=2953747 RepID=UPI0028A751AB|nr:alcohol dehydrogenase catalytic domain-containing protein [Natronosalvus caseinilyticus]
MAVEVEDAVPDSMKAIVLHGPGDWSMETISSPELDDVENVICKVNAASICGTDPKIFGGHAEGWPPEFPFIPGHEWSGEIVEVHENVSRFEPGDRVFGETHSGCGFCEMCRRGRYNLCDNYGDFATGHRQIGHTMDGAFAEYVSVPADSLYRFDESLSWQEAALLDVNAIALQCSVRGNVDPGDDVAVIGTGTVGLLCLQHAVAMGAGQVIAIGSPARNPLAEDLGADHTISYRDDDVVEQVRDLTGGTGVDVTLEAAGSEASFQQSVEITRKGGTVSLDGIPKSDYQEVQVGDIVKQEIDFRGARAHANKAEASARLVENGQTDVESLITHEFDFEDFEDAFETFTERKDGAIKVALNF